MRTFLFLSGILLPALASAAGAPERLPIRPARVVEILCSQNGSHQKITGSSSDLAILRIEGPAKYEVYKDDFIVASCQDILVKTP